jgi:hypothetical protein
MTKVTPETTFAQLQDMQQTLGNPVITLTQHGTMYFIVASLDDGQRNYYGSAATLHEAYNDIFTKMYANEAAHDNCNWTAMLLTPEEAATFRNKAARIHSEIRNRPAVSEMLRWLVEPRLNHVWSSWSELATIAHMTLNEQVKHPELIDLAAVAVAYIELSDLESMEPPLMLSLVSHVKEIVLRSES